MIAPGHLRMMACFLLILSCAGSISCKPRKTSEIKESAAGESDSGSAHLLEALAIQVKINESSSSFLLSQDQSGDIEALIKRLETLVDVTKEEDARDHIGQILIRAYFDAQGERWATDIQYRIRQLYSRCSSFENCMRKLMHLSFTLPFSPESLTRSDTAEIGAGFAVVLDELGRSAEQLLTRRGPVSEEEQAGWTLMKDMVRARVDVLRTVTYLYDKLNYNSKETVGRIPFLKNPADMARITQKLKESEVAYSKLLDLDSADLNSDAEAIINDREHQAPWYTTLLAGLVPQDKMVDPAYLEALEQHADPKEFIKYLLQRSSSIYFELYKGLQGVKALQLYLERLASRNPTAWLNKIAKESDPVKARIAMECLQQFGYYEIRAAYGKQWVETMRSLSAKFPDQGWKSNVETWERQYADVMAINKSFLKNLNSNFPERLIEQDQEVAKVDLSGGVYESFYYQNKRLMAALAKALDLKRMWKNRDAPSTDEWEKFSEVNFEIKSRELALNCYFILKQYKDGIRSFTKISSRYGSDKEIDPLEVCFYGQKNRSEALEKMQSGQLNAEAPVVGYLTAKKKKEIWAPVIVEGVLTILSAPLLVAAGVPTGGAAAIAGKQLAQESIKVALRQMTTKALIKWTIKGFILNYFESCVFAASVKVLYAGAFNIVGFATDIQELKGTRIIYNSKKSFMSNVGAFAYDSLAGVPFLMFLPAFSIAGGRVNEAILKKVPSLAGSRLGTELIAVGADVGSNFVGMLTIGQSLHFVESQFEKNQHLKALAKGSAWQKEAYLALAFSLLHRRGHKIHAEKEEGPDTELTELIADVLKASKPQDPLVKYAKPFMKEGKLDPSLWNATAVP